MITLYHQTNTPISFWYRRRLNLKSLIQPSETLSVELIGTYLKFDILNEEMEEGEHVRENIRNIKHHEAS